MAKIPTGATVELEPPRRQTLPPDALVTTEPEVDALDPKTKLGAAVRGAGQGMTLGSGDELGAAMVTGASAFKRGAEKIGLMDEKKPAAWTDAADPGAWGEESALEAASHGSMADAYRRIRDGLRGDNKKSDAAHPVIYGGSELLGSLAVPMPGGAAKSAGVLAKIGKGALQAGAMGTVMGAGKSEAEDVGGVTSDALRTGAISAPLGAAGGLMSHGADRLGPYFSGKAGERAVQAVGARAGITDRLDKMGIPEADVPALGLKFMDEGLVPTGLNPFRNPLKQTSDRAKALKASSGKLIGDAVDAADASGASFDPARAQEAMRAKMNIQNPLEQANSTKASSLVDQVGDLAPQGEYAAPDSFARANKMKSQAWEGADFRADPKVAPKLYKKATAGLRDDIQRQVGEATSPEIEQSLAKANARYGTASKAETLSDMALSRDVQKQQFSPMRMMISAGMGGGLGAAGGPGGAGVGAVLSPLVVNAIASRGPNFAAHFNKLMSQASESPEAAAALQRLAGQLGIKAEDLYGDRLRQRFGGK